MGIGLAGFSGAPALPVVVQMDSESEWESVTIPGPSMEAKHAQVGYGNTCIYNTLIQCW